MWVEYRLVGDRWELHAVHVYEQTAQADVEPPSAEQAQRLFGAAWPKDKCEGFGNLGVKLDGAPRYQQGDHRRPCQRQALVHLPPEGGSPGQRQISA